MWILTPLQAGGETHYLLSGKEFVVGRKNCDVLLPNDQSISRAHALLTATDQTLTVKDTSKYGTFINSQRLTENLPVSLNSGDEVTFGVFHSKFSVDCVKPVVCSSCLDNNGKTSLSQALQALGGKLVNTWTQDCTHLAMPTTKVTIKTISALLCCCPIVKPDFFSELNNAAQQKRPPPKAESFIPEIDEPSLSKEDVNLRANPLRKQLFNGKTFIFLSAKQMKRLSAAVSFGGGKSHLLEENSLPRELLESPQSCVVDTTTGSSQTLLSSSATEWANSVKNIVHRKGLRVITESEIGLAAIYASCDKYCNPSSVIADSAPKVKSRIPGASLSQNAVVDETVLLATSQNITAYAVNTEISQRVERCEVTEVTAVGETPEKKLRKEESEIQKKTTSQHVVDETVSSSFSTAEKADLRKRPDSKPTGLSHCIRSQPSLPKMNGGTKTFPQKQSPLKQRASAQASPQKQSTLTNFFTPVNKKRPLEDEDFAVMSESKRPVLESSITKHKPLSPKERYSSSELVSAAASQHSAADLLVGLPEAESHRVSHSKQEGPQSKKRKEMQEEIQMDELESIMSEDMDFFDEPPSGKQGQKAQTVKQGFDTAETSSSSKRPRLHKEESETNERAQKTQQKESGSHFQLILPSDDTRSSIKTKQINSSENRTSQHESSEPPRVPPARAASTSKKAPAFEDDEAFIKDLEQLQEDVCQPKEESKTPSKPITIKQEIRESSIDENLPQKLVVLEFRSLTVSAPAKTKPQRMQDNGCTTNFKRFRKINVPGAQGAPLIIGRSDLLVHNRGKNTDVDEWLKITAEEEHQRKQDETAGDDLFRYNPTKLAKRR